MWLVAIGHTAGQYGSSPAPPSSPGLSQLSLWDSDQALPLWSHFWPQLPGPPLLSGFQLCCTLESPGNFFFLSLKTKPLYRSVESEFYWEPGFKFGVCVGAGEFNSPSDSSVHPWSGTTLDRVSYSPKKMIINWIHSEVEWRVEEKTRNKWLYHM